MPIAKGGGAKAMMNAHNARQPSIRSLDKHLVLPVQPDTETTGGVDAGMTGGVAEEEPTRINIKRTIAALQRWQGNLATGDKGTFQSYLALGMYAVFFGIFTYVVCQQLKVQDQYMIDNVVRHSLLGQDTALASVATHGDFFNYLLADFDEKLGEFDEDSIQNGGGILGTLFDNELYNGDPVLPSESGMLYQYNKLVGGVLITQKRGKQEECKPSSYKLFYQRCYDVVNVVQAEPCRGAPGGQPNRYADCPLVNQSSTQKKCAEKDKDVLLDTSKTDLYKQYLQDLEDSKFGDRVSLEDANQPYRDLVKESFEYRYNMFGYSAWLSLADGTATNRQKVEYLREKMWLDLYTREIEVKFIFYNGNFGTFTYVSITFGHNTFGTYNVFDPVAVSVQRGLPGSTRINIGTLNMEPYLTAEDFNRLGVEIVFMVMVFYYILTFIFDLLAHAARGNLLLWSEKYGMAYIVMDCANFALHVSFIYSRINIVKKTICNPVHVPTPSYNVIFEEVAAMTRDQLNINFCSILLGMLRFFKYYQFQPRLQIVNKTIASAMIHIFHFMVLFIIIHVTFSFIGFLNFGPQNRDFSTLGNAMMVMAEAVMSGSFGPGPSVGNYSLAYIDAIMGNLFFQIWAFLVQMILLNIFVAILMDGYAEAQEEGAKMAERFGSDEPDSVLHDVSKFLSLFIRDVTNPEGWHYDNNMLLTSLQRLNEKIPVDEEYDEEKYRKELAELKEEQQVNENRIKFLESYVDPEHNMHVKHAAYHPYWHKKWCTLEDVAAEMKVFEPKMAEKINVESLKKVYTTFEEDGGLLMTAEDEEEEGNTGINEHSNVERAHMLERYLHDILQENAKIRKELREAGIDPH